MRFEVQINQDDEELWIGQPGNDSGIFSFAEVEEFLLDYDDGDKTILDFADDQTMIYSFYQENF